MQLTRRGLLAGAAVGGGLLVAWTLWPRSYDPPLAPGRGEWAFGAWLKIARDGVVTVAVPQLEMGQGVTTLLPQVIAVELGADWRQIAVEPAPVSGAYANVPLAAKWAPLWMPLAPGLADDPGDSLARRLAEEADFVATAEGTSLAAFEQPCRLAAATARSMLMQAAADRWDVGWEECDTAEGFVVHSGKRLSFGELAEVAAEYEALDPPPLRPEPASERPLPGESEGEMRFSRLDLPAKVDGSFLFAGDVRLPGLLYAAIRHGPVGDAALLSFDEHAAGRRGLARVVKAKRWIAALGETWWTAEQALEAMDPRFRIRGPVDTAAIEQALDEALREGEATRIATRGDGDSGLGEPDLTLRYEIAPATHATLETASATARLADGRLELWLASQAPERARAAAAKAAGIGEDEVVLYPLAAGGSFDRRLEHDHAIEAAILAREASPRPVQLIWSRWQEALAGRPRQPLAALVSGWTDEGSTVEGLRLRVAMPAAAKEFGRRLFANKTAGAAIAATADEADTLAFDGALPAYAIPAIAVDHVPARTGLPAGRMRGNSHAWLAFLVESFVDEVAARAGREPLSYRIEMLGQDARLAECLQRAARLAQWDGGAQQSGQGIACWRIPGEDRGGGRIACVATARAGEGGVRVGKLAAAVDIGRIVNLDIARQQIEGGLIFGMSLALGSALTFEHGLPVGGRLTALNLPVLADCPEIAVDFIESSAPPFDPGELGVAVAAPAIANALHSATGLRLRRLPLLSGGL
jgi:isoquinoline 1-oxidoreductase beta subunit